METIAYSIGSTTIEVALGALGVGLNAKLEFGTHGESTCTLPLPALPPEIAAAIPFEAQCIVYVGRVPLPGGSGFSGGTILFQGRRTDNSGQASASSASQQLVIEDAWYDLRFLTYQMLWRNITGYTETTPTYGTSYIWPDSVLFQETFEGLLLPNGTFGGYSHGVYNYHVTTGDQIRDILAFAIYYGRVNLQIGQIDPAFFVPFYPVRSMRCADAIKICLRPHPDCTCEIDYTTTTPTFNIRQQSNLTPVTLPYKSSSLSSSSSKQTHLTSDVKPRPELQPSRVGIYIKETSTINGNSVVSVGADIYPLAAPTALRSLDVSLDMTGPKLSRTTATLTTAAFNPASLAWWAQKVPALQPQPIGQIPASGTGALALLDATVNGGITPHPKGIQVLDNSGNPIDPTQYGYELLTGTPANWMQLTGGAPVQWIEANVTAFFSYTKATTAGTLTINDQIGEHMHTCRVKLINTATATFTNTQILATGEIYPAGLAQYIYNSLSTLQYDFTHTILEAPFATIIKPGKHSLNLSGGAAAWTSMNAMIQAVTYELISTPSSSSSSSLSSSKTSVKCGPVQHLEAGELVQLFNLFTNRDLSKINPNERSTGQDQSGGQVSLGSDSPKENSAPAQSVPSENNNVVVSGGQITGQTIQSAPIVAAITAGKTPIGGGTPQAMVTMQPREMAVCDNAGNFYYAAVQATQGHTTP